MKVNNSVLQVKPLEFVCKSGNYYVAQTPLGELTVCEHRNHWVVHVNSMYVGASDLSCGYKEVAQEKFNKMVLDCLSVEINSATPAEINKSGLIACPFCGELEDVGYQKIESDGDDYREFVICNQCGADIDSINAGTDVVALWNTRSPAVGN